MSYDTDHFCDVWEMLAEAGYCDSIGGAEYDRIVREWNDAGRPEPETFIVQRANGPVVDRG